jgi:predicted dehydrogenase
MSKHQAARIPLGLIGAGAHAGELLRHAAPLEGMYIASCAPDAAAAQDRSAGLARRFDAAFVPDWRVLAADPGLPAVLVLGAAGTRTEAVVAALRAGKVVLCPFPAACDAKGLAEVAAARAQGAGRLLSFGEIAGTAAGLDALTALKDGRLGTAHSIWAAVRSRRDDAATQGVVAQHGWQIFDFLLAACPDPVVRAHATRGSLFGGGPGEDTAVIMLRFEGGLVATVELSRCLPASMPVPEPGEVEIEAIGAEGVIRIEPYNIGLRIHGDVAVRHRAWMDGSLVRSLPQVAGAVRDRTGDESGLERAGRAIAIMDRIAAAAR